jgi:hypothetical protein
MKRATQIAVRCRRALGSAAASAGLALWLFGVVGAGAKDGAGQGAIEHGRQLIQDNGCNGNCHQRRVGGTDPAELFTRAIRQANSREELRRKVEACVSRLATMIFPDDIDDVVNALDADFYRFGDLPGHETEPKP